MESVEPPRQYALSVGERLLGETFVMERVGIRRFRVDTRAGATGEFRFSGGPRVKNKFTRNWAYVIDGLIRNADVSVFDEGGTSRTSTISRGFMYSPDASYFQGTTLFFELGGGGTPPTVTDNNLVSTAVRIPCQYVDTEEEASATTLVLGSRYALGAGVAAYEIGFKHILTMSYDYATLLSRAVLSPPVGLEPYVERFDVYAMRFPAEYTVHFVRVLCTAMMGTTRRLQVGRLVRAYDGTWAPVAASDVNAGAPDVRIGSDSSAPSPAHHRLLAGVASLSSQSQSVEVDTALQEVRVVRSGTITPTASLTFGEVAMLMAVNVFIGSNLSVTTKTLMVARKNVSPPVTLAAGTTYTIGIALVFS